MMCVDSNKPVPPNTKPFTQSVKQQPSESRIYHEIVRPFHSKNTSELLVYFSHICSRVQCVPFLYTELGFLEAGIDGIMKLMEPYFQMYAGLDTVKI